MIYEIINAAYKRASLPLVPKGEFIKMVKALNSMDNLAIVCGSVDNKMIGVRIAIIYNKTIYDWYAGSIGKYHSYYPNDILVWSLLEWGATNNYNRFDFGGAGHPNKPYGVREFKRTFGGVLIEESIYLYKNKPVRYWILQNLIKLKKVLSGL